MPRRNRAAQQRRVSTPSLMLSPAQMSVLQAAACAHVDAAAAAAAAAAASPPDTPTESLLLLQSAAGGPDYQSQSQQSPGPFYSHPHPLCAAHLHHHHHPLAQDPNIRPFGNGHHFSYRRPLEQLSPGSHSSSSSSSSSSDAVGDLSRDASSAGSLSIVSIASLPGSRPRLRHIPIIDEASQWEESNADADAYSEADSDSDSTLNSDSDAISAVALGSASEADAQAEIDAENEVELKNAAYAQISNGVETCHFTIEDIDPMDSGCEDLEVLLPTEVESSRSRSRSEHEDLDKTMMHHLKNLNCSNKVSDDNDNIDEDEDGDDDDDDDDNDIGLDLYPEKAFLKRQQELKRIRRVSMSSSFGKRSHSELSDSDDNDGAALDVSDLGSSARRLRKRVHRGSLLFQDAPAPRIDELEEPNSSEDEYAKELTALKHGLSYWRMEMMETDSN